MGQFTGIPVLLDMSVVLLFSLQVLPDGKVTSGSTDGILKIHDPVSKDQSEPHYVLDATKLLVKQAVESEVDVTQIKSMLLTHSKITCIESYKELVIYGDEGFNIKVLDYRKGKIKVEFHQTQLSVFLDYARMSMKNM